MVSGSAATSDKNKPADKPISTRQIADLLAKLVGGSTVLLAMWLAEESVAMTPAEANAIAKPAARLLVKQTWFVGLYRWLIQAGGRDKDLVALLFALGVYGWRVAPLVSAKLEEDGGLHVFDGAARRLRQARESRAERQAARNNRFRSRRAAERQREEAPTNHTSQRERHEPERAASPDLLSFPAVVGAYGSTVAEPLENGAVNAGSGGIRPFAR